MSLVCGDLCVAFIYSGTSHSFASERSSPAHRLGLSYASSKVGVADGRSMPIVGVLQFAAVRFFHSYRFNQDLLLADMPDHDVVLGMDFLRKHNPKLVLFDVPKLIALDLENKSSSQSSLACR
jgi:hypothetical protein